MMTLPATLPLWLADAGLFLLSGFLIVTVRAVFRRLRPRGLHVLKREAVALAEEGERALERGYPRRARRYLKRSASLDAKTGTVLPRARVIAYLGLTHLEQGELDAAEQSLRKALDLYEAQGNRHAMANTLGYLGMLHEKRGDLPTACAYWEHAARVKRQDRQERPAQAARTSGRRLQGAGGT